MDFVVERHFEAAEEIEVGGGWVFDFILGVDPSIRGFNTKGDWVPISVQILFDQNVGGNFDCFDGSRRPLGEKK
jgi:hypothetical protein